MYVGAEMRGRLGALVLVGALVGCAPVPTVSPSPSGEPQLARYPAALACDAMRFPYKSATLSFSKTDPEAVRATTDLGKTLRTYWADTLLLGPDDDSVIRDVEGRLVAADGDVIANPERGWPRLRGSFVCLGENALWVMRPDPL